MKTSNFPYINPTPGRIPILATTLMPSNDVGITFNKLSPSQWDVNTCKDCGFSIIGTPGSETDIASISELCNEANEKCNINLRDLAGTALENRVNKYKSIASTAFWDLGDEPHKLTEIKALGNLAKKVYEYDKNHMSVVNLIPFPASYLNDNKESTVDWSNDDDYFYDIQSYMSPAVWMFDYYPIRVPKSGNTLRFPEWYYRNKFYDYLKRFSDLSKSTSRPFWYFCRSVGITYNSYQYDDDGHILPDDGNNPIPTLGQLRFVAFSALAFGAQGLGFWTYAQRKNNTAESYSNAPIYQRNVSGSMGQYILERAKSPTWEMVKTVISKVRQYNDIFYDCELMQARCTRGAYAMPQRIPELQVPYGPLIKFTSTSPFGALVTILKNGTSRYLVIVNRDIEKSQEIVMEFGTIVNPIEGPIAPSEIVQKSSETKITLEPGDMKIYYW